MADRQYGTVPGRRTSIHAASKIGSSSRFPLMVFTINGWPSLTSMLKPPTIFMITQEKQRPSMRDVAASFSSTVGSNVPKGSPWECCCMSAHILYTHKDTGHTLRNMKDSTNPNLTFQPPFYILLIWRSFHATSPRPRTDQVGVGHPRKTAYLCRKQRNGTQRRQEDSVGPRRSGAIHV